MYEAAERAGLQIRVVSFKASMQAIRNWEPHLNHIKISKKERFRLIENLHEAIILSPIRQRPDKVNHDALNGFLKTTS